MKKSIILVLIIVGIFVLNMYDIPTETNLVDIPDTTSLTLNSVSQSFTGNYWVPFISGDPKDSVILPKSRDSTGFCIDTNFFGMYVMKREMDDGDSYHQVTIPNCGNLETQGKPAVPHLIRFFEVPMGVKFSLKVIYEQSKTLKGYNVIPSQELHEDLVNDSHKYKFTKDTMLYTTNALFPSECARLESDPIIIRGHRLLPITFYPIQFNPVTKEVRTYSKIEVRVNYNSPAQIKEIPDRLLSPAFEEMLDMMIPNYQYRFDLPLEYPIEYPGQERTGCDYLIIAYDTFTEEIQLLANWKQEKGYLTRIVKTSEIKPPSVNPTVTDIANYIKNAYETWTPAPSFVLLVGDSDFIPTHYKTPHLSLGHGGYKTPTDLYYFTVDGEDYFPDIYYGRLAVNSEDELKTVASKIVRYETDPPTDPNFYRNVLATAQFQDDDLDDYEDRRFTLTSEEVRDYLQNDYTVTRVYTAAAAADPRNYSVDYDAGLPIPADLLRTNGFAWNGDDNDITNALQNGCFFVYHRDHAGSRNFWNHEFSSWWCNTDHWGDPFFGNAQITALTNGELLPVVLSIECQSCWFDSEVDQFHDGNLTRNFESICELFVNQPNGGAVAAIGATRNSNSGYNDQLVRGMVDAIWPDFDPAFNVGEIYHLGHMLNYGKFYMTNVYGYDKPKTKQTFEMFHLIGDPEMEMWTDVPAELMVEFPEAIGSGSYQEFIIKVSDLIGGNPIDHARVCLDGGSLHQVKYTNPAGEVIFNVLPSTTPVKLTVTKHNFIPFQDDITVTSLGASLDITPSDGPAGITATLSGTSFGSSETVSIYFGDNVVSTTTTTDAAGVFTISPYTVPSGSIGFLNVVAKGSTSGRTAVTLYRRLPNQPLPDPHLYCQWADDTWYLNPGSENPRWNNPVIQLIDTATSDLVASSDLIVGHTYTVKATIFNDEPAIATDTEVTFEWAFWGAGQKTWYKFGDDKVTVPARVGSINGEVTAEALWTPAITGHICLMISVYHPWDLDFDNNNGQENTHVHPVSSPATATFTLSNPSDQAALIYLEARQIGSANLWPVEIQRDYPQVQTPGENKTIKITVNTPEDVQEGEKRIYVIDAYIDGILIGGVEIEFVKSRFIPTSSSNPTSTKPSTSNLTSSESSETSTTTTITPFSIPLALLPTVLLYYWKKRK
ncbi:MAG: C25 family cysteine peptidase [Promethearchaeota archaeon]